jgi:hypothetical protein
MKFKFKISTKIRVIGTVVLILYFLGHLPLFFLYPNYDQPLRKNIDLDYFYAINDTLQGDCLRVARNFAKECPFPTREVHLNSEHTIVEILINEKWYAYDPSFSKFFNNKNAVQLSYDVRRGYIAEYMKDYPYTESFKKIRYYHHFYFVVLGKLSPFYDIIILNYYPIIS